MALLDRTLYFFRGNLAGIAIRRPAFLHVLVLLLFIGSFGATRAAAQNTSAEYRIKAAFLFDLRPIHRMAAASFREGKVASGDWNSGSDPFGQFLDETVRNELIQNRPVEIGDLKTSPRRWIAMFFL